MNYHRPVIETRFLENTDIWCIFLKQTLTFEESGKMVEVQVLLNHLKSKKSFSLLLFEKENWLVKVGEVKSEIMSGSCISYNPM